MQTPILMTDAVGLTSKKDWASDQEVRWCPGCGDYGILLAVQQLMPELGVAPENTVFISGIGCSSRFPYYMNTYGMHSIHGRAPAIATGVAVARPDLDVWVITGDGDGLSIGGNHLIHALRRNVNLTILLFNNRIYGLTKGQYSPTSEIGKVTKSTPFGSVDPPFNPLAVALGAEASFVARTHDLDRKHMMETFRAAHDHRGAAFVEIFQNCNVFNDGQFNDITKKQVRDEMMIELVHGEPIRFGADRQRGVVMGSDGQLRLVDVAEVGEEAILVHDAERPDPSLAFALARLSENDHSPTPFGVFRTVSRPEYASAIGNQLAAGLRTQGPGRSGRPAALERNLVRRRLMAGRRRSSGATSATEPGPSIDRRRGYLHGAVRRQVRVAPGRPAAPSSTPRRRERHERPVRPSPPRWPAEEAARGAHRRPRHRRQVLTLGGVAVAGLLRESSSEAVATTDQPAVTAAPPPTSRRRRRPASPPTWRPSRLPRPPPSARRSPCRRAPLPSTTPSPPRRARRLQAGDA